MFTTILSATLFGLLQAQYIPVQAPTIPVVQRIIEDTSSTTIRSKIREKALFYKVSAKEIIKTVECESNYNKEAVGDNGNSFGIVQINLPAHPEITKEKAFDIDFAIEFITSEFAKGNQWKWSCWKKYYGNNSS